MDIRGFFGNNKASKPASKILAEHGNSEVIKEASNDNNNDNDNKGDHNHSDKPNTVESSGASTNIKLISSSEESLDCIPYHMLVQTFEDISKVSGR